MVFLSHWTYLTWNENETSWSVCVRLTGLVLKIKKFETVSAFHFVLRKIERKIKRKYVKCHVTKENRQKKYERKLQDITYVCKFLNSWSEYNKFNISKET